MKKKFNKIIASIGTLGLMLGLGIQNALAAENADLAEVLGTTTPAFLNDNMGIVLKWIAVVFGFTILITIVIAALNRATRQVGGAISGGRRRR